MQQLLAATKNLDQSSIGIKIVVDILCEEAEEFEQGKTGTCGIHLDRTPFKEDQSQIESLERGS